MVKKTDFPKTTAWYVLNSPEMGKPLSDFYNACDENGVLDQKTKKLLMLTIASVFRCPRSTELHIKAALEAGVSKEEITEALLIAAAEEASTQLSWAKEIYQKYLGNSA